MRESELIELLEVEDLPESFKIVGEICGLQVAKTLITELGGIQIAVPKVTSLNKVMIRYIRKRQPVDSPKKLARDLEISERTLRRFMDEAKILDKIRST